MDPRFGWWTAPRPRCGLLAPRSRTGVLTTSELAARGAVRIMGLPRTCNLRIVARCQRPDHLAASSPRPAALLKVMRPVEAASTAPAHQSRARTQLHCKCSGLYARFLFLARVSTGFTLTAPGTRTALAIAYDNGQPTVRPQKASKSPPSCYHTPFQCADASAIICMRGGASASARCEPDTAPLLPHRLAADCVRRREGPLRAEDDAERIRRLRALLPDDPPGCVWATTCLESPLRSPCATAEPPSRRRSRADVHERMLATAVAATWA